MTENEEFIFESIISQVKMGFLSIDEIEENIIEEIEDNEFEDEISEKWALKHIKKEWANQIAESKKWKSPTDTERLTKAFDDLCNANIIALHNAGYTTSDGEDEVVQVEVELRKKEVISDGYCFYHEQDLARALEKGGSGLYLAFQKVNNTNDEITVAVGEKVVEILRRNDFEVEWDGTANSKIGILNFHWQLIYDDNNRNLLDYRHVVELMTK
jgi:hypothetical protein